MSAVVAVVGSEGGPRSCGADCPHAAEAERWRLKAARRDEENRRLAGLLEAVQGQVRELTAIVEALRARLATLLKEHFGPRSERQATPAGEEPPKEPSAAEPPAAGPAEARPKRGQKQGAPGHGRGQYAELPAVVVRHECKPEECRCKNCGTEFEAIAGPKTSQEIDIRVVAQRVIHERQRYRRKCACTGTPEIITAPAPPKLIRKGLFTTAAITWLLIEKFQGARPLHRSTQGLQQLTAADLAEGTLGGVFKKVQPLLHPLAEAIRAHSMEAAFAQHDETSWPTRIADGRRGPGWLWYTGTSDTACFEAADTRSSAVLDRRYAQMVAAEGEATAAARPARVTMSDFYAVYRLLGERYGLIVAYCWAHLRRYFLRAAAAFPHLQAWSEGWLEAIRELYRLHAARQGAVPDTPAWHSAHLALKRHLDHLLVTAESQCFGAEREAPVQKVLMTLLTHWDGLTACLDHPEIPLDNNGSERALRNPVVCRKNFSGSGAGWSAALAADVWTVCDTVRLAGLNPATLLHAFLDATVKNQGCPLGPEQLQRFLPWSMTDDDRAAWSRALWGDSS